MSSDRPKIEHLQLFMDQMRRAGAARAAIDSFALHFGRIAAGDPACVREDDIEPIGSLPDSDQFGSYRAAGEKALHRVVVIKLNGGLGTSMGLERAKSLLEVRNGLNFLDLIARQILSTRSRMDAAVPLILMNSANTAEDAERVLTGYADLVHPGIPVGFLQNRVPKILASDMTPAQHPNADLGWCPPGHGDLYTAIAGSGLLARLIDQDFEYAFVSNADNLGAVLDPEILGYLVTHNHDFMMEVADRTAADRKGGHLCRLSDGRLALRESAQCRPEDEAAFQEITRHRFFNTNNLWFRLPALADVLDHNGGFLPLDTIVNRKTLDPRDPMSPAVLQLETAMGAAISLFEDAAAVRVPRRRFSPVKNTDDLLAVRSDAYELTEDWLVALHPDREVPPNIKLDRSFYKMIDDFEERFPKGPPSLRRCDSLLVEGDVVFGNAVTVEGTAVILTTKRGAHIPDGARVHGKIEI